LFKTILNTHMVPASMTEGPREVLSKENPSKGWDAFLCSVLNRISNIPVFHCSM